LSDLAVFCNICMLIVSLQQQPVQYHDYIKRRYCALVQMLTNFQSSSSRQTHQ